MPFTALDIPGFLRSAVLWVPTQSKVNIISLLDIGI